MVFPLNVLSQQKTIPIPLVKISALLACIVCSSVATVRTGVFANLSNKMSKFTGKFEDVDEAKIRGVFRQD